MFRLLNYLFGKISVLYMNRTADYGEAYFDGNHLRHLQAWYGAVIRGYYRYLARVCLLRPAGLDRSARVLDIGCGVGILVEQFRRLGVEATGVDVSPEAIAHSLVPEHCRLVKTTAQLPYADRAFDLVVSREVLEHIPGEEIDACILEWDRVSRGGMIHIIAVSERGPSALLDPTHVNVQSENWWVEKFAEHGFVTERRPSKLFVSTFGDRGYLMMTKRGT